MKPDPERPEVCLSADLLAPEGYGEIIGGGQRIDDLELLASRIKEHNLLKKHTNGIWASAVRFCAPPGSALVLSGLSLGYADLTM